MRFRVKAALVVLGIKVPVTGTVEANEIEAKSGIIYELNFGGGLMAITGVQAGQSGSFQVIWNGAMSATNADTWTVDDPLVTLSPGSDMSIINAAVAVTDAGASFTLTVTGTNSVGTAVTATAVVPIIPAPPAPATGGVINQLS